MKKLFNVLSLLFLLFSCEDVLEVDLPKEDPRLIINAVLRVDKSEEFVGVKIKLTESADYFGDISVASGASVNIQYGVEDEQGFMESPSFSTLVEREPGSGIYEPLLNSTIENRIRTANLNSQTTLYLSVRYRERFYFSRTMYVPSVPIDTLEQGTATLFDEDATEIIVTFTDQEEQDDFYVFDFGNGNLLTTEDTFYQGQQFEFSYFYDEELDSGDQVTVSILGADREYYNYMNLLLEQTENNNGIFNTPAATIRGNIFDFTDIDNDEQFDNTGATNTFPLGYFAVVESYKQSIEIEDF